MAFINSAGIDIYYERKGNGENTLIFLHGYAENSRIWKYVNEDTPFHSITMDFPGFGNSEFHPDISMETLAIHLRNLILTLQVENPILVGHSMGGYVALAYANEYPEEVKAIGLLNSYAYADSSERRKERNKSIQFLRKYGTERYIPQLYDSLFYQKDSYIKKTIQHMIDLHAHIPAEVWIAYLEAMRDRNDRLDFIRNYDKPFLFLVGKHDKLIPLDKQLSQAAYAPVSELILMDKSGHMSHFEERLKTREALIHFATGNLV